MPHKIFTIGKNARQVQVQDDDGQAYVHNDGGPVQIQVHHGDINVYNNDGGGCVQVQVHDGDVFVVNDKGTIGAQLHHGLLDVEIRAESYNGEIEVRIDRLNGPVQIVIYGDHSRAEVEVRIGEAQLPAVSVTSGQVRVYLIKDELRINEQIFEVRSDSIV